MIPFLDPSVRFTLTTRPAVAALFQQTADGAGAILADSSTWPAPIVANAPDAAQHASDAQQLSEISANGWVSAAGDQSQLSVDDQLNHDHDITGTIADGQSQGPRGATAAPGGSTPDDPPTDPNTSAPDIRRRAISARQQFHDAVSTAGPIDASQLPADSIDALVAQDVQSINEPTAAPTTPAPSSSQVDPASFQAIVDRVAALEQLGIQGPAGNDGAPGPPGPPGPPGRSFIVFG